MPRTSPKQTSRPNREQLGRVRRYIENMKALWRFSKRMPQWPHWYVLREWGNAREFDFCERLIAKHGYEDAFGKDGKGRIDFYLVVGKFKYWVLGNVLNRAAPISNREMRRRGEIWLRRHGKKVGPYGTAIDAKKAPKANRRPKTR